MQRRPGKMLRFRAAGWLEDLSGLFVWAVLYKVQWWSRAAWAADTGAGQSATEGSAAQVGARGQVTHTPHTREGSRHHRSCRNDAG